MFSLGPRIRNETRRWLQSLPTHAPFKITKVHRFCFGSRVQSQLLFWFNSWPKVQSESCGEDVLGGSNGVRGDKGKATMNLGGDAIHDGLDAVQDGLNKAQVIYTWKLTHRSERPSILTNHFECPTLR